MITYNFNDMEKEVCLLLGAAELIDSIVNRSLLQMTEQKDGTCHILPQNMQALNLFAIRTVDFISPAGKLLNNKDSKKNLLVLLEELCKKHSFATQDIRSMKKALDLFSKWLKKTNKYEDINFASIAVVDDVKFTNELVVRICGNISKHNLTRLDAIRNDVMRQLNESTRNGAYQGSISILYDVENHFLGDGMCFDKFIYNLAYHFNNISHCIRKYLYKEYKRSFAITDYCDGCQKYTYNPPADIGEGCKYVYWELMNWCRKEPIIELFEISDCWKN